MQNSLPEVAEFFPFWNELTQEHRDDLLAHSEPRVFKPGDVVLPYKGECLGLLLVQSGQLRAFVLSENGKEVTLYRLYEWDTCLFSAACIMNNIQFDIHIKAEKETQALLVPVTLLDRLMNQSVPMGKHINELMASRFSEVMWTLEQVLFKSMDSRLATALLGYAAGAEGDELALTHEAIARDIGTAREVVTRLLKYFRGEGLLELTRGRIRLLDVKRLRVIAEG